MFDFQGISSYPIEKRKTDSEAAKNGAGVAEKPPPGSVASQNSVFNQPIRDYSTFQFQTNRTPPALNPPPEPPKPTFLTPFFNSALMQGFSGNFERIASQVASFFWGNRKEKPSAEEQEKRNLNDFFTPDFMGERKVEEIAQSGFGDGSD